ncbi:MAG TPA: hypothetical protein VHA14_01570 [Bryobacteraceae bacterium]|nr:hypothetical protein [Bryobacteraceae bacterium]
MLLWVACGFFVLAIAAAAAGFCSHLPALGVHRQPGYSPVDPKRYQALIQLLRKLDTDLPDDPQRRKIAREERHERIRAYLRALTIDYGRLLHELRLIVVRSQTDRPELIHTLEKNRITFACAMCRIDLRLSLNRWRIGDAELLTKEVMTLVNGLRALQLRTRFVMESTAWGADTVT